MPLKDVLLQPVMCNKSSSLHRQHSFVVAMLAVLLHLGMLLSRSAYAQKCLDRIPLCPAAACAGVPRLKVFIGDLYYAHADTPF